MVPEIMVPRDHRPGRSSSRKIIVPEDHRPGRSCSAETMVSGPHVMIVRGPHDDDRPGPMMIFRDHSLMTVRMTLTANTLSTQSLSARKDTFRGIRQVRRPEIHPKFPTRRS